ncbi:hypothetical protein MKEN_01274500 [Mycena kentingensis (nom. inval.)]|nr:hypothetical protein MKEN_01274500 [Mycena kentingensis (nom. inval.)]
MPWSSTPEEQERDVSEIFMMNYMRLVGAVFLYWDHFITLDREIDLLWRKPKCLSSYCFFANRYFAFLTAMPVAVIPFLSISQDACEQFCIAREVVIVVTQTIIGAIMVLRIYALFARSKRVLYSLVALIAAALSVVVWSMQGQEGYYRRIVGGCHWTMSDDTAIRLAAPWEALFVFDATVFGMTVYNAITTRKANGPTPSLQTLVVRDGASYFGIVALVNLLNIVTYYVDNEFLSSGILATVASAVSVTVMSRLILNLHKYAAHAGILSTSRRAHRRAKAPSPEEVDAAIREKECELDQADRGGERIPQLNLNLGAGLGYGGIFEEYGVQTSQTGPMVMSI